MSFFDYISMKYRRMHRNNPVFAWVVTGVGLVLALLLVLTLAPLIMELVAVLLILAIILAAAYGVAVKLGIIDSRFDE